MQRAAMPLTFFEYLTAVHTDLTGQQSSSSSHGSPSAAKHWSLLLPVSETPWTEVRKAAKMMRAMVFIVVRRGK